MFRGAIVAALVAAIALAIPSGAGANKLRDGDDAVGPLDLARVVLAQKGRSLRFQVKTREAWKPGDLDPHPGDGANERYACLRIRRTGQDRQRQLCFGPPGVGSDSRLGLESIASGGGIFARKFVDAHVDRIDARTVEARFKPRAAGLRPHAYRWRALSRWSGSECEPPPPKRRARAALTDLCLDAAPDSRQARFDLRPVQVVGCVDSGPSPVFHGPRSRKRVALTFDDGPSAFTASVLSELRHAHVHGTFFEVGDQIPGRTGVMRDILRAGDEIGNHSLHHELMPGFSSLAETNRRIHDATGFTPCLFRPPYGGYDSGTVAAASSLDMTTVIWDVDPTDWSTPGSAAIYQRVVGAVEPGSIVLMHDGGGDRSQTVAAVPDIIRTLKARGYRLVTVSRLLGQRLIWRPVG